MGLQHLKAFDYAKVKYDNYEVSGIDFGKDNLTGEVCGGDTQTIQDRLSKAKAFSLAKKESKKKQWYEVQVRHYDQYNDLCGHWYFKNGTLTNNMAV